MPTLLGNAGLLTSLFPHAIPVRLLLLSLLLSLRLGVPRMILHLGSTPLFVGPASFLVALLASRGSTLRTAVAMSPKAAAADDEPRVALPPAALDQNQVQASRTINRHGGHQCACSRCIWRCDVPSCTRMESKLPSRVRCVNTGPSHLFRATTRTMPRPPSIASAYVAGCCSVGVHRAARRGWARSGEYATRLQCRDSLATPAGNHRRGPP